MHPDNSIKEKAYSQKKSIGIKNNFQNFLKEIILQRMPIFRALQKKYNIEGEILDIGAGSCWLTALISKIPKVKKIYALDISDDLLKFIGVKVIDRLKGEQEKIKFVCVDFKKLPFSDNKFDIIVIDAALHHARDLPSIPLI